MSRWSRILNFAHGSVIFVKQRRGTEKVFLTRAFWFSEIFDF